MNAIKNNGIKGKPHFKYRTSSFAKKIFSIDEDLKINYFLHLKVSKNKSVS